MTDPDSNEYIKLYETNSDLLKLRKYFSISGNVWGWLVPVHLKMSVKPISLVNDKSFSVSVGRDSICSFVLKEWMLQGDTIIDRIYIDQISRLHFEIFCQNKETFIVGKSSNGTFVQGNKLIENTPKVLKHGDMVAVLFKNVELFCYLEEEMMLPVEIITKYCVGNEVGRGTFGVVKEGFVRSNFEPVAFKFLSKSVVQFLNSDLSTEVKILKQLNHSAVIGLKDVMDDANNYIIVMEFMEGGDLEQRVLWDRDLDLLNEKIAKIQVSCYG